MNYLKIYNSIINRAKNRILDKNQYYEKHHITPKSKKGNNNSNNLVHLTFREHILVHWLLHNEYPKDKQLAAAFHMTVFGKDPRTIKGNNSYIGISSYIPSTRILEAAKIAKRNARIGTKHSKETIQKMKKSHKIRKALGIKNKPSPPITEETKRKMSLAHLGKKRGPFTEEHKAKLKAAKALYHPLKGKHHSLETIEKMKNNRKPLTKETIEKMKLAKLGKKRKPFTEEHKANLKIAKTKNK